MRADEAERIAEILADWQEKNDRGEAPSPPEVIRAHPEIAEALVARFAAMDLLDRAGEGDARAAAAAPDTLGDFRILREIGRGGMGVVYEAEQVSMGRRVALKVLFPSITSNARAVERFRREARAAGRVHHTNLVPVYGMGEERGTWYYAMEMVRGRSLAEIVEDLRKLGGTGQDGSEKAHPSSTGTLGTVTGTREFYEQVARLFAGAAEAIETAHQVGIVHRDLKPSNLILDAEGTLKVMDFGLARLEGEGASMTVAGDRVGTPAYMSPEQAGADGGKIDFRTDVYSLGATLYELLTLRAPFRGRTGQEIYGQIATREPPTPRRMDARIPRDLETIVLKAMEKDRGRRYASAAQMARDLRNFAEGAAIQARRVGPAGKLWRTARRRPLVTTLACSVLVLGVGTTALYARSTAQAAMLRNCEYERLCVQAGELGGDIVGSHWAVSIVLHEDAVREAREVLGKAVALRPDRWEAYVFRACIGGASHEERLADLDFAVACGLTNRAHRFGRAAACSAQGHIDAARDEEAAARACGGETDPVADYFESRLLLHRGDRKGAVERLTQTLEHLPEGGPLRTHARYFRADARELEGDLAGALDDLSAIAGDPGDIRPFLRVRIASLWRRLGQPDRAESIVAEVTEEVRRAGSPLLWHSFARACGASGHKPWRDRASEEAIRTFPDSIPLLILRADALDRSADLDGAGSLYDRVVVLEPGEPRSYTIRAQFLLAHGRDPAKALRDSDAAIRAGGKMACDHYIRAEALQRLGRNGDAVEELAQAERLGPHKHDVHDARSIVFARMSMHREALEAADRAIALDPRCEGARVGRVNALAALEEHDKALEEAERILKASPDSASGHHTKATSLLRLGQHEEALASIRRSLELRPSAISAHECAINILRHLKRIPEAVRQYDDWIAVDPNDARPHFSKGLMLNGSGDIEGALTAYERALELRPDYAEALLNRGNILLDRKLTREAIESFDRAIATKPDLWQARKGRGIALGATGRHAEAVVELNAAIALNGDEASIHNSLGNALSSLSRLAEAERAFRTALALDPSHSAVHFNLGTVYLTQGLFDRAMSCFDNALTRDPRNAGALYRRAEILVRYGEDRRALEDIETATRILPRKVLFHRASASIRALLGDFESATSCLRNLVRGIPEDEVLRSELVESLLDAGRAEEALVAAEDALVALPTSASCVRNRVRCLRRLGRDEAAREAARSGMRSLPAGASPLTCAYLHAAAGEYGSARALLAETGAPKDATESIEQARVLGALGDVEGALGALERGASLGLRRPRAAAPDPDLAALEKDPRFSAILEQLHSGSGEPGAEGTDAR